MTEKKRYYILEEMNIIKINTNLNLNKKRLNNIKTHYNFFFIDRFNDITEYFQ